MNILKKCRFKSLSSRANQEIKESLHKNKYFLNSRFNFIEKSVIRWSTEFKKYALLSLILASLIVSNLILWGPLTKSSFISHFQDWKELLEWQDTFLSGQLTVVGVVYPLVVGLVSILFQNKSAKKVMFPVYQKYSGFMFAGLSGLMLSLFIVIGYFLRPIVGEKIFLAICVTTALWLSSNLALTAWFFVKTFRTLDENSREKILFRFSIHELVKNNIYKRIKDILLENAVDHNLIINPNKTIVNIATHKHFADTSDFRSIERNIKHDRELKNVRFWLLNIGIRAQILASKLKKNQDGELIIRPIRSKPTSNTITIAQYKNFKANSFAIFLIKAAFSYKKKAPQEDIGLSTVLNGFIGPANDALKENDSKEFLDALDNLASWHTELAQALSFKNDSGNLDNWLMLQTTGFLPKNYLDELLSEYYRLAKETVERIPSNSRFYVTMLHFYQRIFSGREHLLDQEMKSLIQGSYYMWYLLVEWRSYSSESSDLRVASKYEDILYDFVGTWESWLFYIEPRTKRTNDIKKTYPAFLVHLEHTASTIISALRFNNFEAAGWGIDMLINWLNQISNDDYWHAEYSWRSILVNHSHLLLESNSDIWQTILKQNDCEYNHITAFNIAFKNAYVDLRVITACYILLKPGKEKHDVIVEYIKALLNGTRIHPTGTIDPHYRNIFKAGEILGIYIRHRDYGHHGKESYGGWLSSILESFGRIYDERKISGRIYSGWGASGIQSMNIAYVQIILSLSSTIWDLPHDWEEAIFSSYFSHIDRETIISDLSDWIKIVNEIHNSILINPDDLENLKENFISSVEKIIQRISSSQKQVVIKAQIDKDQLSKIGVASSAILNTKKDFPFPLRFFKYLALKENLEDKNSFKVSLSNYDKKLVAIDIKANRAINENEYLADLVLRSIKSNILKYLIRYPQSILKTYTDIESLLFDIKNFSRQMTDPLLFIGNQNLKITLRRYLLDSQASDGQKISRYDGYGNEYICHIGNCEVYTLGFSDIDYCILTNKELFEKLSFREIAQKQYVDAKFEVDDNDQTIGNLVLTYRMKVELCKNVTKIKLKIDF